MTINTIFLSAGMALFACPYLFAQDPLAAATGQRSPRPALTRNAGLQAHAPGVLRGGGAAYEVTFDRDGVRYEPMLGRAVAHTQHFALRVVDVRCGGNVILESASVEPRRDELVARYDHSPGLQERFEVGVDGVALSWSIAQRPVGHGDLVVRYALDTSLPGPRRGEARGLVFDRGESGGVTVSAAFGIDANGTRVDGSVRCDGGLLELLLPASFVEDATYPIVLDPIIGTKETVQTGQDDAEPDVAYDLTTQVNMVTFLRTFSASDVRPRAQLTSGSGAPLGNTIFFSVSGVCGRPRVANLNSRNRFGVVWSQQDGIFHSIRFAAVSAVSGTISHTATLASSTGVQLFLDPDIGADTQVQTGTGSDFLAIWEDNIFDAIRARRVYFDGGDNLVSPSAFDVFTNTGGIGSSYTEPAISKACGDDQRLMVVARRFSGIGPSIGVSARTVTPGATSLGPVTSFGLTTSHSVVRPDVDGYDGRWVVAWGRALSPVGLPQIGYCSVKTNAAGTGYDVSNIELTGGTSQLQTRFPTVGWAPGRTWLGYDQRSSGTFAQHSLRASAIDTGSAVWCGDTFTEPMSVNGSDTRMVVGTQTSGGRPEGEFALAVFAEAGDVYGQRLRNFGSSTGGFTLLGPGCGNGGVQGNSHAPGIGSSQVTLSVNSLPSTALLTIFNMNGLVQPAVCGPCVITPFAITVSAPINHLGNASVSFPIPCQSSLVGQNFETQWATVDLLQAPCGPLAGVVFSDRWLMTVGN